MREGVSDMHCMSDGDLLMNWKWIQEENRKFKAYYTFQGLFEIL